MNKIILTGIAALFLTLSSEFGLGVQAGSSVMGKVNDQNISSATDAQVGVTGDVNVSDTDATADVSTSTHVSLGLDSMRNF